ncbi:hypothetical protein GGS26DRAFT_589391 [Hypomontagnella submonticulosa]|nr:hypothetical protein GGS26DRAFT_589391 [Hypomontagnella submonticulosa]
MPKALRLGGHEDFHTEKRHHLEVFRFRNLPKGKRAPIDRVHFDGMRGRHGTIPVRLFYPRGFEGNKKLPPLTHFHGGRSTIGSVDEFENNLRHTSRGHKHDPD